MSEICGSCKKPTHPTDLEWFDWLHQWVCPTCRDLPNYLSRGYEDITIRVPYEITAFYKEKVFQGAAEFNAQTLKEKLEAIIKQHYEWCRPSREKN